MNSRMIAIRVASGDTTTDRSPNIVSNKNALENDTTNDESGKRSSSLKNVKQEKAVEKINTNKSDNPTIVYTGRTLAKTMKVLGNP